MNFSIKSMLVMMAIAALVFNAWRINKQNQQDRFDIAGLKLLNQNLESDVVNFELQKKAYKNFFSVDGKRRQQFAKAEPMFREMASHQMDFVISDPTKPHLFQLPTYDTKEKAQKGWRVFVPESTDLDLTLSFMESRNLADTTQRKDGDQPRPRAMLYVPREPFSMHMPEGESDIIFEWLNDPAESNCRITVNGEVVLELDFLSPFTGYSSSAASTGEPFDESKPFSLYRFTPYNELPNSETIWLRIKPSDSEDQ